MTSKTAKKRTLSNGGGFDAKFINYSLSNEQKRELKAASFAPDDFVSLLDKLADSGYKVSFSFDAYDNCFACFFTPKEDKNVNKGLILTARGSTTLKAFKQACYLHFQLFEENWTEWYTPQGREPMDD